MKQQLYRSLTPVSTAATVFTSPDVSDVNSDLNSNHTYEPIETAGQAFSSTGDYANTNNAAVRTSRDSNNIPVTLIHHDGHRVTANKITNLETLRDTLMTHEQIPYDDPENRGDLYILAPMRLLTPIMEETDSELTRSKIYQELSSVSRTTNNYNYSSLDTSIMSIISEVLSVRQNNENKNMSSTSHYYPEMRLLTADNLIDTNCLLSTIEEIRNNSMCNLYNDAPQVSATDQSEASIVSRDSGLTNQSSAPQVPPRGTLGYQSLCQENSKSKEKNEQQDLLDSFRAKQDQRTVVSPEEEIDDTLMNESIKSINSNTLVTTPNTVKQVIQKKKKTPLQSSRGCRKNILNIVHNTRDILNTPKRVKTETVAGDSDINEINQSVASSDQNEFKALMPHLTYTGVKFLKNVTRTADDSDMNGSILQSINQSQHGAVDQSEIRDTHHAQPATAINNSVKERLSFASPSSNNSSKLSVFTNTPSPVTFVRNIGNQKRKLSIVREKRDIIDDDNNSDYKYGFVKENPDAKYGFGFFPTDSYNVLETAKLSNNSYRSASAVMNPVIDQLQQSLNSLTQLSSSSVNTNNYNLAALNKHDTVFKLHPDETYENLQRNNWVSSSLQRHGARAPFADRDTVTRRSMSILDDMSDEKENMFPRSLKSKSNRAPLGSVNSVQHHQQASLNHPPVINKLRPQQRGVNNSSHFVPIRKTSVS